MVHEHITIAKRWAFHRMQPKLSPPPYAEKTARRMVPEGDVLNSYGSHFPLVRLIRTRSGKPSHWLVNGDRWRGGGWSMTGSHQADVLRMVQDFKANLGMGYVIVPQSVLDAAGIMADSVQIIEATEDTYENRTEEYDTPPDGSYWTYDKRTLPGTGGWVHERTGQWVAKGFVDGKYVHEPPGKPHLDFTVDNYEARWAEYHAAERRWQLEWVHYPAVEANTGRKRLALNHRSHHELELYARESGQIGYRYTWRRHWLGESVIRAQVPYRGTFRCHTCKGTGVHPHAEVVMHADGPLTQRRDEMWHRFNDGTTSWERDDRPDPEPRYSAGSHIVDRCETCGGARKIQRTRTRWAYFLSGFDHNEPQPSYFFTELPPGSRPRSVADAYDALKPATVRLAEEMGRPVQRQGDQFFIEMPGLTLRELKRMGGVHVKRSQGLQKQLWERDTTGMDEFQLRWHKPPRFQRLVNEDAWLHGTTHEATEVVRVGTNTYARGIVRHVPEGRTPDHVKLKLGTTWHLNIPNRTPVGS